MGGEYITWFNQDGSEERSLLYKLESMGITILHRKSVTKDKGAFYEYRWDLTTRGQEIVDKDEELKKIWNKKAGINVQEFYKRIIGYIQKEDIS